MTENEVNEIAVESETEQAAEAEAEAAAEQAVEPVAEAAPERKTVRKVFGRVVSNGADKTVSVSIERVVKHPVYGKYIRRTSRVMAHDEDNACQLGDRVAITECRPLSKRKSWRVVEVFGSNGAPQ
ncbi:MAG: 30S ribosomal protein S17 [Proteobacteria bacterium]|nr:30S ribosomal protein S17 [Pseudomonadota bacterium]MYJ96881.1 30S ribosomal protein S17 [Pseudomonadota bacterium]